MTYGCHNRQPFADTVKAVDGWENAWLPHRIEVPFVNSRDCQYTLSDLGRADQGCIGCQWRAE